MPAVTYPYIEIADNGLPRVKGTRMKVAMIVQAHRALGGGEEVQKAYPMVSLAQILL